MGLRYRAFSSDRKASVEGYVWGRWRRLRWRLDGPDHSRFFNWRSPGRRSVWLAGRSHRARLAALTVSILTYSIFSGAGYLAQAPWHLAVFRFLAAIGMGGEWAVGVALVMECWPDKHRPWLAGTIGAAANIGIFLSALSHGFFRSRLTQWRWMFLVGASPALLTFLIRLFVPESERWKMAVGRRKAARYLRYFRHR